MKKKALLLTILLFASVLGSCAEPIVQEQPASSEEIQATQRAVLPAVSVSGESISDLYGEVAWLTFPGTSIDGAVMQASDNDFFLRRNENGEEDVWGCYFMDYASSTTSKNVIIYGHSLEDSSNGERFSQLKKLNSDAFAEENSIIDLTLPDGTINRYQVFSAGYAAAETDTIAIVSNPTAEEFQQIVDAALRRTVVPFDVEVLPTDQVLTLSTCTSDENTRYLVVAKLLEEE